MNFKGKVVLVTGATRGIGKAIAIAFAKQGAKVVVNYSVSREEAEKTVEEINALGSEAIAVQCNVSDVKQVKQMIGKTLEVYRKIDVLINNAGIFDTKNKKFTELTASDWERILKVNLIGTFLCTQAASIVMKRQKSGKIVNISSIRGLEHCGRTTDYGAAKAGVINFTKTVAKELAPEINVNAVAPGWIDTESNADTAPEVKKIEIEKIYLKRMGKPEEIANAVLFLASEEANYITGQVLVVDGGYSLK